MTEAKGRKKFIELAEKRVTRAIKAIRLIGNLSNRSNYSYSDEDVKKIIRTLRSELDAMSARFEAGRAGDSPLFKL